MKFSTAVIIFSSLIILEIVFSSAQSQPGVNSGEPTADPRNEAKQRQRKPPQEQLQKPQRKVEPPNQVQEAPEPEYEPSTDDRDDEELNVPSMRPQRSPKKQSGKPQRKVEPPKQVQEAPEPEYEPSTDDRELNVPPMPFDMGLQTLIYDIAQLNKSVINAIDRKLNDVLQLVPRGSFLENLVQGILFALDNKNILVSLNIGLENLDRTTSMIVESTAENAGDFADAIAQVGATGRRTVGTMAKRTGELGDAGLEVVKQGVQRPLEVMGGIGGTIPVAGPAIAGATKGLSDVLGAVIGTGQNFSRSSGRGLNDALKPAKPTSQGRRRRTADLFGTYD